MPGGLVALAVNLPLLYLLVRSADVGLGGYLQTVLSGASLELLLRTLALVAGVTAVALAIALSLAWLVVRTDLKGRRVWAVLGALPLVFPSYVAAFAIVAVLGPRGFVQGWLQPLGVDRLPDIAYGYSGALASLALFTYPYIYLLLVAALRSLDPALEESSRVLGRGPLRTWLHVVLPQLRPAAYAGALLVALYTVSDFGAVSLTRYSTLTLSIYNAYQALFDRSVAACLATVLVAVALGLIVVQAVLQRGLQPSSARPSRTAVRVALGAWQWPCQAWCAVIALLGIGMPVAVIVYWAATALSIGNPLGQAWRSMANSFSVSALAALVAVVASIPVAVWRVRYHGRLARLAERLSYAGFALPGLVIALALVFFSTRRFGFLYQTIGLLVAAYVIRFLPEALSATRSALSGVAPSYEEAARSLGRGGLHVLRTVTLPLIRPGLLAGAGLVFLTSMKELPATLVLRPTGFETLATRIWSAASDGVYSEAAVPALLLLLAAAAPIYLFTIRPALDERSR